MALNKITYENKETLSPQIEIPNKNKCTSGDMNEIKSVVNDAIDKLDTIEQGAEVNVQANWNQTTTTADDYIKNKPSINNATLTIQKNGSNVATFTANASSNATANISVPVFTTLWTNSNPNNDFGSQQITLSGSNYDLLLIIFNCWKQSGYQGYGSNIIPKGLNGNIYANFLTDGGTEYHASRFITRNSDTKLTFGACRASDSNGTGPAMTNNAVLIPYKVIGIKF